MVTRPRNRSLPYGTFRCLVEYRDKENGTVRPRIGMITIGVDDLRESLKFYRDGLGLKTEGIIGTEFEHGAIAVFDLQHGFKLALFARPDLALDAGMATTGR